MILDAFPSSLLIVVSSATIGRTLVDFFTRKQGSLWLTTRHSDAVSQQTLWLDVSQPASTWQLPDAPIHTAIICVSVTSLKTCQEDYAATYAINVIATVELAKRLIDAGALVIFISSSLVFDGSVPLVPPDHPINPQTAYGQQKAEAEQALLALSPDSVAIVRLSKVLDEGFPLFQKWIDSLNAGQIIHPFADLYFAPISTQFATHLLFQVSQQRLGGIIQASASHDVSYADVAYRLAQKLQLNPDLIQSVSCETAGITHAPRHTTLRADRLDAMGLYPPDPWQVIDELFPPAFPPQPRLQCI